MKIKIEMPDGSLWEVDPKTVQDSYKAHYADATSAELNDGGTLKDWMQNNMNWEDVKAVQIKPATPLDPSVAWAECDFFVIMEK